MQNQPAGWEIGDIIAGLALGLSLINLIVGVFVERYRRRRSISIEDAFLFPVGYTSDFCWLVVLATLVNNTHACLSFTNARLRLKDGEIKNEINLRVLPFGEKKIELDSLPIIIPERGAERVTFAFRLKSEMDSLTAPFVRCKNEEIRKLCFPNVNVLVTSGGSHEGQCRKFPDNSGLKDFHLPLSFLVSGKLLQKDVCFAVDDIRSLL